MTARRLREEERTHRAVEHELTRVACGKDGSRAVRSLDNAAPHVLADLAHGVVAVDGVEAHDKVDVGREEREVLRSVALDGSA